MSGERTPPVLTELWASSNPPWGIVRAVLSNSSYAIVLDDLNGDYREVELSVVGRERPGWGELFHQDDAGYPADGDSAGGGPALALDGHFYSCLYGRTDPGSAIRLLWGTDGVEVTARSDGWWFFVTENDNDLILRTTL